jgi:folate-binding Fe-S cluster repair protein YgfZ
MSTPFASPAAQPASASLPVFPRPSAADFDAPAACMPLAQFGVIDVAGDDAATFLHGQLTNDIEHLDAASARVAGYCSPKGRLLASFLAWREGHGVRLLVSKDVQAAVQKRLSMFVLRAKAKLSDASDAVAVVGFSGDVRDALSGVFDALPDGVHVKVDGPAGVLIRVPDAAGRKRYLWIGPRAEVDARIAALAGTLPVVSPAVWDWLDVRAGEPRITQPVVEQFVPQMVNFDVIGAVNFRKGATRARKSSRAASIAGRSSAAPRSRTSPARPTACMPASSCSTATTPASRAG